MKKIIIFPQKSDYPDEIFRYDLPIEYQVGCAKAYFRTNFISRKIFIKRIEEAINLLPDRTFKTTLDIGTGAGFFLPTLSRLSDKVHAIDLSPVLKFVKTMLARRHIDNVYLSFGDLTNLAYPSNFFDLIVCLSVIEHVEDLKLAYTEIHRVLQKNGILILGYPIENKIYKFLKGLLGIETIIRTRITREKKPIGQGWFHPHVSIFEQIEKEIQNFFHIEETINLGFFLFNLYRVSRLIKK